MLSEKNKNWNLLSVCDEARWTHIIKQSSYSTGFVNRMPIWLTSLHPSSLRRQHSCSSKAGITEKPRESAPVVKTSKLCISSLLGVSYKESLGWRGGGVAKLEEHRWMTTLIKPRYGSSSLGARSTKQVLQSWATLSSRLLKTSVLKTQMVLPPWLLSNSKL